jgi:hypothetical protein
MNKCFWNAFVPYDSMENFVEEKGRDDTVYKTKI